MTTLTVFILIFNPSYAFFPQRINNFSWITDFGGYGEIEYTQNFLQGKRKKSMKEARKLINVKLRQNQKYTYDLGMFGDEEGAQIHRQASHFSVSEIEREPEKAKYFYTPEKDYIGTDEVEILIERGSDGASPHDDFSYIIIKFTISKK